MVDSLFDKSATKKFDDLAKRQAQLNGKKGNLAKETMEKLEVETLVNAFEIIDKFGHPNQKKTSKILKNKYDAGNELDFDDLMSLNIMYKSNIVKALNKDVDNE